MTQTTSNPSRTIYSKPSLAQRARLMSADIKSRKAFVTELRKKTSLVWTEIIRDMKDSSEDVTDNFDVEDPESA